MISLLIAVLILVLIVLLAKWLLDISGLPENIRMIILVIVVLIVLASLLHKFGIYI